MRLVLGIKKKNVVYIVVVCIFEYNCFNIGRRCCLYGKIVKTYVLVNKVSDNCLIDDVIFVFDRTAEI